MSETALVIALVILVCVLLDAVIMILARFIPKKNPSIIKIQPYESGNPSIGVPKYVMPMPYVGFLVMFMAFEPVAVLFLIFAAYPTVDLMLVIAVVFILMLPALFVSYRDAIHLAYRPTRSMKERPQNSQKNGGARQ